MSNILSEVQQKLGKTYYDLEFLLNCFKEVLIEGGEGNLAEYIPWINDQSKLKPENFTEKHVQLYSICFHLLNMVEENGAVQTRRKMEDAQFSNVNGLWGRNLKNLKEKGISENEIAEMLPDMRVEPVLTAHPTEAKRSIVLEYHRNLYLLLVKRENSMYTELEQKEIRKSIKLELDRLWRTGEIYLEKPDVQSELQSIIHYLTTVFPEVIPIIDRRLIQAWEEVGFNPNTIQSHERMPRIRFGDWVGGDRDGHPFVTAEVTKKTLETLRLTSLVLIQNNLKKLGKNLCFTAFLNQTNKKFQKRIQELADELGQNEALTHADNKREIFRVFVNLATEKLPVDLEKDSAIKISNKPSGYKHSGELIADLEILVDALTDFGAKSIGYTDVRDVLRLVQTFGFHLAYLDIRQNSAFHDKALSQLLEAALMDGKKFLEWDETERLKFINKELLSPRPFSQPNMKLGPEAEAVTGCYRVVAKYVKNFTSRGIGSLIVSMTRSLSDLLVVYLLERETGLIIQTEEGLVSR
ncbi:MAG: phosphoenolpyruvate carboxylase, partial [Cytophagales bacterium]|nr:phosphoenolpyruvate carboxylase [Cytophagales bacterium]